MFTSLTRRFRNRFAHRAAESIARSTTSRTRNSFRPILEQLDRRDVPATATWAYTGSGAGVAYVDSNWVDNYIPQTGDDVVVPSGTTGLAWNADGMNGLPSSLGSITIEDGHSLQISIYSGTLTVGDVTVEDGGIYIDDASILNVTGDASFSDCQIDALGSDSGNLNLGDTAEFENVTYNSAAEEFNDFADTTYLLGDITWRNIGGAWHGNITNDKIVYATGTDDFGYTGTLTISSGSLTMSDATFDTIAAVTNNSVFACNGNNLINGIFYANSAYTDVNPAANLEIGAWIEVTGSIKVHNGAYLTAYSTTSYDSHDYGIIVRKASGIGAGLELWPGATVTTITDVFIGRAGNLEVHGDVPTGTSNSTSASIVGGVVVKGEGASLTHVTMFSCTGPGSVLNISGQLYFANAEFSVTNDREHVSRVNVTGACTLVHSQNFPTVFATNVGGSGPMSAATFLSVSTWASADYFDQVPTGWVLTTTGTTITLAHS